MRLPVLRNRNNEKKNVTDAKTTKKIIRLR